MAPRIQQAPHGRRELFCVPGTLCACFLFLTVQAASSAQGEVKPSAASPTAGVRPVVEVEEDIYHYQPANNGAGPMWCHGNTCIVRTGDRVFASGIETIPGAKPLNNCLPLLFVRDDGRWQRVYRGNTRTREPCPVAVFPGKSVLLSVNPTLTKADTYRGPARPEILDFTAAAPKAPPQTLLPGWQGQPPFTEHSYRSFAVDGPRGELILFQNIGYTHAEWAFRDQRGTWAAQGKLVWPWGARYDRPQPIRVCYPTVALKDRAVFFCGVSDIVEPYKAWRDYKKQLTGRDWDYDFRRLFFTWSDDITTRTFHDWVEVASRDKTCGWMMPADLYLAPTGDVFLLWTERAIDERLRPKFFPAAKQRHRLRCAILRQGKVVRRTTLVEGGEGLGGQRPRGARFHVTGNGRLFLLYYVGGTGDQGEPIAENRLVEMRPDGSVGPPMIVPLKRPLASFFTATVRAGCRPAPVIDVLGANAHTMRYAAIRLFGTGPPAPRVGASSTGGSARPASWVTAAARVGPSVLVPRLESTARAGPGTRPAGRPFPEERCASRPRTDAR